ncbi:hypothetical protein JG688_00010912 [Phytophthora aleatoria]|uniref:Protein kinase n=1 Tax=Phytophthora aleatoria TaxID=2496075 RepID=A0A8J5IHM6_9STRA|nr:hypothetical protein JG688_00010912 [Phytophthora aleatoria]
MQSSGDARQQQQQSKPNSLPPQPPSTSPPAPPAPAPAPLGRKNSADDLNLPLRANAPPAHVAPQDVDARARLLSQKIAAMDASQSGAATAAAAVKTQSGSYGSVGSSEPATGIKKAQSYQALADLEKKGYFPVAPKPSALGVQRGLKDSVVNDMCRAVVKHMVGDVYVSASGSYGQRKVLNHLYEPVFASVQAHFRRLPARYALSVNPDDVPLHMRLLAQNQRDPTAIAVNAQLKKDDNGEIVPNVCEVVVVSLDRENILDAITRALTTMKGNILDADVMTTSDGTLLDRFVVKGSFMSEERQEELRTNIEQNLRRLSMEEDTRPSATSTQDSGVNENVSLAEKLGVLQMVDKNEIKAEWKLDLNEVRLEKAVGSGRSGSTYSAWWRGTHVAAKVVDSSTNTQAVGEELLNEFHREVAVVSKLRHPNIVLFLGAAINPPLFEFMENGTLTDLIRGRRGPIDFFRLVAEMAMGMNYLHLCSIMHRDLKSGNVLIDSHGTAKISDFGLSCVLEIGSSSDLTAETGTYRWMAPEVIRHEPYSSKADVYSFGIVLWELLARDQPFRGLTPIQAAFAVARQQMRPALPRQTPQKIGELIEHCWHHDPARRPDFGAILEALPLVKRSLKKRDFKNMGIFTTYPTKYYLRDEAMGCCAKCFGCAVLTQLIAVGCLLAIIPAAYLSYDYYLKPWAEDHYDEAVAAAKTVASRAASAAADIDTSELSCGDCLGVNLEYPISGLNSDYSSFQISVMNDAGKFLSAVTSSGVAIAEIAVFGSTLVGVLASASAMPLTNSGLFELSLMIAQGQFISLLGSINLEGVPGFFIEFCTKFAWTNLHIFPTSTTTKTTDATTARQRQLSSGGTDSSLGGVTRYAKTLGVDPDYLFYYTLMVLLAVSEGDDKWLQNRKEAQAGANEIDDSADLLPVEILEDGGQRHVSLRRQPQSPPADGTPPSAQAYHQTTDRFPSPVPPYPPLVMADSERDRLEFLAHRLNYKALEDYDVHRQNGAKVDARSWKLVRKSDQLAMYKRAEPSSLYQSPEARQPATAIRSRAESASIIESSITQGRPRQKMPILLQVGAIQGTLNEVMYGTIAVDGQGMMLKTAYTDDTLLDGETLCQLRGPSATHPFRFLGVKWVVKGTPHASMVRSRDLVFLEATGILTREDNNERVGYHLMHSVSVPGYGPLDDRKIVRGQISSCILYTESPDSPAGVDVFMKARFDPNGNVSESVATQSAALALILSSPSTFQVNEHDSTAQLPNIEEEAGFCEDWQQAGGITPWRESAQEEFMARIIAMRNAAEDAYRTTRKTAQAQFEQLSKAHNGFSHGQDSFSVQFELNGVTKDGLSCVRLLDSRNRWRAYMSTLHKLRYAGGVETHEVTISFYEVRAGKQVFAIQLQERALRQEELARNWSSITSTSSQQFLLDEDDENNSMTGNTSGVCIAAMRSYSQFRKLWRDLIRATKTPSTASLSRSNMLNVGAGAAHTIPRGDVECGVGGDFYEKTSLSAQMIERIKMEAGRRNWKLIHVLPLAEEDRRRIVKKFISKNRDISYQDHSGSLRKAGLQLFEIQQNAIVGVPMSASPHFLKNFLTCLLWAVKEGFNIHTVFESWLAADSVAQLLESVLRSMEIGYTPDQVSTDDAMEFLSEFDGEDNISADTASAVSSRKSSVVVGDPGRKHSLHQDDGRTKIELARAAAEAAVRETSDSLRVHDSQDDDTSNPGLNEMKRVKSVHETKEVFVNMEVVVLPMCNDILRDVIWWRYIGSERSEQQYHQWLIRFFRIHPTTFRRVEELPWHLKRCYQWDALRQVLVNLPMFQLLYTASYKAELFGYWKVLTDGPLLNYGAATSASDPPVYVMPFDVVKEYGKSIDDWYRTHFQDYPQSEWDLKQSYNHRVVLKLQALYDTVKTEVMQKQKYLRDVKRKTRETSRRYELAMRECDMAKHAAEEMSSRLAILEHVMTNIDHQEKTHRKLIRGCELFPACTPAHFEANKKELRLLSMKLKDLQDEKKVLHTKKTHLQNEELPILRKTIQKATGFSKMDLILQKFTRREELNASFEEQAKLYEARLKQIKLNQVELEEQLHSLELSQATTSTEDPRILEQNLRAAEVELARTEYTQASLVTSSKEVIAGAARIVKLIGITNCSDPYQNAIPASRLWPPPVGYESEKSLTSEFETLEPPAITALLQLCQDRATLMMDAMEGARSDPDVNFSLIAPDSSSRGRRRTVRGGDEKTTTRSSRYRRPPQLSSVAEKSKDKEKDKDRVGFDRGAVPPLAAAIGAVMAAMATQPNTPELEEGEQEPREEAEVLSRETIKASSRNKLAQRKRVNSSQRLSAHLKAAYAEIERLRIVYSHAIEQLEVYALSNLSPQSAAQWYEMYLRVVDLGVQIRRGEIRHRTTQRFKYPCMHKTGTKGAVHSGALVFYGGS